MLVGQYKHFTAKMRKKRETIEKHRQSQNMFWYCYNIPNFNMKWGKFKDMLRNFLHF